MIRKVSIMLVSYPGIVKDGQIELQDPVDLPDGSSVLVILNEETLMERRQSFDAYHKLVEENPAEQDIASISDEELNEIVHEVRRLSE